MKCGEKVFNSFLGNSANLKRAVTFWRKRVGIEGNERVFRAMLLERIVKGEEAGEVSCVCYKSSPYLTASAFCIRILRCQFYLY